MKICMKICPNVEILVPGCSRILLVEMPIDDFPGFGWSEPDRARASLITIVLRDPSWRSTIRMSGTKKQTIETPLGGWHPLTQALFAPHLLCWLATTGTLWDMARLQGLLPMSVISLKLDELREVWGIPDTPKWSAFKVESPRVKRYL